jgi:hypothetical protein
MIRNFTTHAAVELLTDEGRSNGSQDLWVMVNTSKTIELETTTEEIDRFQLEHGIEIDSDTVSDEVMASIIEFFNAERLLAQPI